MLKLLMPKLMSLTLLPKCCSLAAAGVCKQYTHADAFIAKVVGASRGRSRFQNYCSQ
jgi:hypothetical protein